MCGRYVLLDDAESLEIFQLVKSIEEKYGAGTFPNGEIFPTNKAPVFAGTKDGLTPQLMTWGFPHFKGSGVIINARAETAMEKKMFRSPLQSRRCVIPTTGFYEWRQEAGKPKKVKYQFNLPDSGVVYLAGFYNEAPEPTDSRYVILTTDANDSMRPYHHRMPVLLSENELQDWVYEDGKTNEVLHRVPRQLIAEPA